MKKKETTTTIDLIGLRSENVVLNERSCNAHISIYSAVALCVVLC